MPSSLEIIHTWPASGQGGAHLLEIEAVGDVVCGEEGGHQVGDGSSLATVGPELEGVQASFPSHSRENVK